MGWQETDYSGQSIPVGGVVYYISPPGSLSGFFEDPIHGLCYILFVIASTAMFSRLWIDVSGSSAKDVAKELKDQGTFNPGYRDSSTVNVLNRYIPIAASCGGMCIGLLTIFADIVGAIGYGDPDGGHDHLPVLRDRREGAGERKPAFLAAQRLGGIDVCAAASKRRLSSRWPPLPPPPRASNPLFRAESASRFCRLPYAAPRLGCSARTMRLPP